MAAPAPAVPQRAIGFLAHYRGVGGGGTRAARLAILRRVPAFRGQSYAPIQRGFAQWHIDMRLDLTYPHPEQYIMQELMVDGSAELIQECIDRGTAHDDASALLGQMLVLY